MYLRCRSKSDNCALAQACITGGKAARAAPRPKIMVMTLSWWMAGMRSSGWDKRKSTRTSMYLEWWIERIWHRFYENGFRVCMSVNIIHMYIYIYSNPTVIEDTAGHSFIAAGHSSILSLLSLLWKLWTSWRLIGGWFKVTFEVWSLPPSIKRPPETMVSIGFVWSSRGFTHIWNHLGGV